MISRGWGGGENVVHQMLSCLIDGGTDVFLITNNEMKAHFEDLNLEIIDLGSLYDSGSLTRMIINPNKVSVTPESKPLKGINMFLMYFYFHRVKGRITKILEDRQVDVLHTHLEYSDVMGLSLFSSNNKSFNGEKTIKWIVNIHGPWFSLFYDEHEFPAAFNSIFHNLLQKVFHTSDKIVFVSKYLYDQAKIDFPSESWNEKGLVIHNGIDLSKAKNLPDYNVKKGFNILFPGGPKLKKGGDILIEAVNEVVNEDLDINLYIALDVPKDHIIRRMVHDYQLEDRVNFVGFLKTEDYLSLLSQMDVLALPSRMEPFGMVYLEAMSLGIPVIASNIGGGVEIVKNRRNGLLVSPDPKSVVEALFTMYAYPDMRKKMSQNNFEDIKNFTWNKIINNYLKVYPDLKS
jgi:glycosyltransferase involved in cell wall biosynthesis